jgi:hypothetical protein
MAEKQEPLYIANYDKVRGIYSTSSKPGTNASQFLDVGKLPGSPKLVRDTAATDKEFTDVVTRNYLPRKTHPITGWCVEYINENNGRIQQIDVELEIYVDGTARGQAPNASEAPILRNVLWGRPKLSRTEIMGKYVELWMVKIEPYVDRRGETHTEWPSLNRIFPPPWNRP